MGEHYKVEVAGNRQPKQTVGGGWGPLVEEEQVTVYWCFLRSLHMGQLYYTSAAAWVTQDSLFIDEPWHIAKKKLLNVPS